MDNIYKTQTAALASYQSIYGLSQVLTWNKVSYSCRISGEQSAHDLEIGGQYQTKSRSATLARSQFHGPYPQHGDFVSLTPRTGDKPIKYRVESVTESQGGEVIQLRLVAPDQK